MQFFRSYHNLNPFQYYYTFFWPISSTASISTANHQSTLLYFWHKVAKQLTSLLEILSTNHYGFLLEIITYRKYYFNPQENSMIILTWYFHATFQKVMLISRCLMGSTNQANQNCFYFRILWILMERRCFYFFCPLGFLQGLRSKKIK